MPLNHYGDRKLAVVRVPFSEIVPDGTPLVDAMVFADGTDSAPSGVLFVLESEAFATVLTGLLIPEIELAQVAKSAEPETPEKPAAE